MNVKIREDVNINSIVLKHKIGLETITLLDNRGNILDSEIELYTMVSVVDNFIEDSIIQLITEDERDFPQIVEEDIEPLFYQIIEKYNYQDAYREIIDDIIYYKEKENADSHSLLGILNIFLDALNEQNWNDLQFFFNDLKGKAADTIAANINVPEKADHSKLMEQGHKIELEGASDKLSALIDKFQKQSENMKNDNE